MDKNVFECFFACICMLGFLPIIIAGGLHFIPIYENWAVLFIALFGTFWALRWWYDAAMKVNVNG